MPAPIAGSDGYEEARALLIAGGVPFAAQRTVHSAREAQLAARAIGYPVVLKALGRLHKSDLGGVALGLLDETELDRAYADFEQRLSPAA